MNDFIRTEIYSKDEAYLLLMRPGAGRSGGAIEVARMQVPLDTLRDMVISDWTTESLRDSVIFADNGVFSCDHLLENFDYVGYTHI
jgi:hypothetical protein